jgi:hypothetical protein
VLDRRYDSSSCGERRPKAEFAGRENGEFAIHVEVNQRIEINPDQLTFILLPVANEEGNQEGDEQHADRDQHPPAVDEPRKGGSNTGGHAFFEQLKETICELLAKLVLFSRNELTLNQAPRRMMPTLQCVDTPRIVFDQVH